jgi:hypothetical protein
LRTRALHLPGGHFFWGDLRRITQRVEKVGLGPVRGPREQEYEAKTPQKRVFGPEPGTEEGVEGFFNGLKPSTHSAE